MTDVCPQLAPQTISRIDAYLLEVERLVPEVERALQRGARGLPKKQLRTLAQVARIIEETQRLKIEYQRLLAEQESQSRQAVSAEMGDLVTSQSRDGHLDPAARLQQLRRNIEFRSLSQAPAGLTERLRNWDFEARETCGRLLLEDMEVVTGELHRQRQFWRKAAAEAQFGSPGIRGRFLALKFHIRHRSLMRELEASKMKLNSWKKGLEKRWESCESLAAAVMSVFRLFHILGKPVSAMGVTARRFEKIMRIQVETEIMHGIRRRGNALVEELRQEKFTKEQKTKFCNEAKDFVRARQSRLFDLRRSYSAERNESPVNILESIIHISFSEGTTELNAEAIDIRNRLAALSHEHEFLRSALLSRIERIAKHIPYEPEVIEEMLRRKADDNEAFVIPSKEARTRS